MTVPQMTAEERAKLKARVSEGKVFRPWHESLLQHDPVLLDRYDRFIAASQKGNRFSMKFLHLLWVAVDAVVTHLYPQGIALHAKGAMDGGASPVEVFEALQMASVVCTSTFEVGLQAAVQEFGEAEADGSVDSDTLARHISMIGYEPAWLKTAERYAPEYVDTLVRMCYEPRAESTLDEKTRQLLFVGIYSCPAVLSQGPLREHIRLAAKAGASLAEVIDILAISSTISIHAFSIGAPEVAGQITSRAAA